PESPGRFELRRRHEEARIDGWQSLRLPHDAGQPRAGDLLAAARPAERLELGRAWGAALGLVRLRHRAHRGRQLTRTALLGDALPLPLSGALQGELGFVELDVLPGQGELRSLQALLQLGDLARLARRLQSS